MFFLEESAAIVTASIFFNAMRLLSILAIKARKLLLAGKGAVKSVPCESASRLGLAWVAFCCCGMFLPDGHVRMEELRKITTNTPFSRSRKRFTLPSLVMENLH